ncbi:sensor histidine kinase [Silicimonas algicola]|uniref:histidine kinase n=1 Tax=Silicimonas algicola TaxID=1826607 RepID=A0A316G0R6_9RHOB|nr:sensor histidine kinase [Silicimonas algicola]AZQ68364.1 sensor histidine kinase [Silicimonas algicola]PWK53556.1 two-component sensor histidine kinase [Silicimonas algicola]
MSKKLHPAENVLGIHWPPPGSWSAWLLAAGLIVAASVLKPLLEYIGGEPLPPYITFYPAVVIAAFGGGPIVGVVTALVTVVAAWVLYRSAPLAPVNLPSEMIYTVTSIFLAWSVGRARLALELANALRERQEYTARESVHRIKNLIAVVLALVRKVSREVDSVDQFRDIMTARLHGVDVAQRVLVQGDWQAASLNTVIDTSLAPFLSNPGLTLHRGPEATIPAEAVSGLSMALYELCTNSMKYGALAEGRGPAVLSWSVEGQTVVLEWGESAPTEPDASESFGTRLIRSSLVGVRGGRVEYTVASGRVHASFSWTDTSILAASPSERIA